MHTHSLLHKQISIVRKRPPGTATPQKKHKHTFECIGCRLTDLRLGYYGLDLVPVWLFGSDTAVVNLQYDAHHEGIRQPFDKRAQRSACFLHLLLTLIYLFFCIDNLVIQMRLPLFLPLDLVDLHHIKNCSKYEHFILRPQSVI